MPTLLFAHDIFQRHEAPPGHAERPDRYSAVEKALSVEEFSDLLRRDAPPATAEQIELVHPAKFRDRIEESAPKDGFAQFDPDTFMGPSSLDATQRAVGAAIAGVDAVVAGKAKNAFVASRPPGHHAEPERAMGFCFFNAAAIAAMHARAAHGASRIAVVDFDVHHGNGTEAAFWHDENAFFASSHEWPQYPGTGRASDRGAFDNVANAPLSTGTGSESFRRAWGEQLLPALSEFSPEFIVISAGFDAHAADPLGGLELNEEDFSWATREILAIARDQCKGRVISVMEGGYDLAALGACAAAHVQALMDG